jgi:hypothetical protein
MSDEELAQAKVELIQRYLALKERQTLIGSKMEAWAKVFERLGRQLTLLHSMTLLPERHLAYPSADALRDAVEDWQATAKELVSVRQQMHDARINL